MKERRQAKILELIGQYPIDTQEELLSLLREKGFEVTQATVSRDIKELRLVKTLSPDGKYRYSAAKETTQISSSKFRALFADSTISVDCAQGIVSVKCLTGMANAVCVALDALQWKNIVGTLAGDDTIFILVRGEAEAARLAGELNQIIR